MWRRRGWRQSVSSRWLMGRRPTTTSWPGYEQPNRRRCPTGSSAALGRAQELVRRLPGAPLRALAAVGDRAPPRRARRGVRGRGAPARHRRRARAVYARRDGRQRSSSRTSRPRCCWIVKHHGLFQMYYYGEHTGDDPNGRDRYRDSPYFDACVEFCERYDQNCFDPAYDSLAVEVFEPMVRRVFAEPRYLDPERSGRQSASSQKVHRFGVDLRPRRVQECRHAKTNASRSAFRRRPGDGGGRRSNRRGAGHLWPDSRARRDLARVRKRRRYRPAGRQGRSRRVAQAS